MSYNQKNLFTEKKEEKRKAEILRKDSERKRLAGSHIRERLSQERERERKERRHQERQDEAARKIEKKADDKSSPATSGPNPVRISVRKALKDYLSNRYVQILFYGICSVRLS